MSFLSYQKTKNSKIKGKPLTKGAWDCILRHEPYCWWVACLPARQALQQSPFPLQVHTLKINNKKFKKNIPGNLESNIEGVEQPWYYI